MFQILGILLTIASLLLIPASNFFQNKPVGILIMSLVAIFWFLFTHEKAIDFLRKKVSNPFLYGLILWLFTLLIKFLYDANLSGLFILESLIILLIPVLYIALLRKKQGFHWADIFLLLYLFVVVKTKIVSFVLFKVTDALYIKYDYILVILFALWVYQVYRGFDIGYDFKLNSKMVKTTLLYSVIMILINTIVSISIGYVTFAGLTANIQTIIALAVIMFFFATVIEEIFFRALFFNYFQQFFNQSKYLLPLIISTLIFGLSHFAMGYKMIILATIAGFFYGITYIKTKNVYCSALIHTLTNLILQLFFISH